MRGVSLWEDLFVVSRKWSFPTTLPENDGFQLHLLQEYVLFSPIGFRGNRSLLEHVVFFSRGLEQGSGVVCFFFLGLFVY